ncbi:putative class III chitinase [Delitschia confertaspora ATCC 74209]|uniref:chitinase n=1 Tax=Delitschia confertaspora ATCC 74209 TaxID=1513339 RepID=A0A9P4MLR0_9PLEO|nr:putative class III chitinase [Delitschia confertaspora ATCC 74209]
MRSATFFTAAAATTGAFAAYNPSSKSTVAVYWGQNSYMQGSGELAQQRLSKYCQDPSIDIINLSFLYRFNGIGNSIVIDFANQGDKCTLFPGTETLNCPEIAADIATCQAAGKTIILSIGGATYNEGGWPSESAASAAADKVWAMFGPQQPGSREIRPFGSSVIDGFDFDFEATTNNAVALARKLRSNMDAAAGTKKFYLTAAPQCVFPDAANQAAMNAVPFDIVWVQFYNNYCGVDKFTGAESQAYNFATWDNWAKTESANKNVKIMVGVPANTRAAGSGYLPVAQLTPVLQYSAKYSSFGGLMTWDVSQAYANPGFLSGVKSALSGLGAKMVRNMRYGRRHE